VTVETLVASRDAPSQFTRAAGASSEMLVVSRLLLLGHRVALPVLDDDGVDLIVDHRTTVQVKSAAQVRHGGYLFCGGHGLPLLRSHVDVVVLHGREGDHWWVVPTSVLRNAGVGKTVRIPIPGMDPSRQPRFAEWLDAWPVFDRQQR
jgi:hypothetical protein